MKRDFWIYSFLFVFGLAIAYYFSMDEKTPDKNQSEYIKIAPKVVTEVTYADDKVTVDVKRADKSEVFWLTFNSLAKEKDGENAPPTTPTAAKFSKANKKFSQVLEELNPLFVDRVLGDAKKVDLNEFGLKDAKTTWQVKSGEKTLLSLLIGKKSYGSRKVFVLDQLTNTVLLIDDKQIAKLEKADKQLFDNQLYDIPEDDITGADIEIEGKKKSFKHTKRDGAGQLEWTDEKHLDKPKASVKTWIGKLDKLRLMQYADDAKDKELQSVKPFLQVKLHAKGDVELQFKKQMSAAETKYWVISTYSGRHAELTASRVEALEKDAPTIVNE